MKYLNIYIYIYNDVRYIISIISINTIFVLIIFDINMIRLCNFISYFVIYCIIFTIISVSNFNIDLFHINFTRNCNDKEELINNLKEQISI